MFNKPPFDIIWLIILYIAYSMMIYTCAKNPLFYIETVATVYGFFFFIDVITKWWISRDAIRVIEKRDFRLFCWSEYGVGYMTFKEKTPLFLRVLDAAILVALNPFLVLHFEAVYWLAKRHQNATS
jgi:hypothetical protein